MEEYTLHVTIVTFLVTMVAAPIVGVLLSMSVRDTDKKGDLIPLSKRRWRIFWIGLAVGAVLYYATPLVFSSAPRWIDTVFGVTIGNLFLLFAASTVGAAIIWEGPNSRDVVFLVRTMFAPALLSTIIMMWGVTEHYTRVDRVNASWVQLDVTQFQQEQAARKNNLRLAKWLHGDSAVQPIMVIVVTNEAEAKRQAQGELTESSQQSSHGWWSLLVLAFVIGGTYLVVIKKKRPQPQVTPPQAKSEAVKSQGWDQAPPAAPKTEAPPAPSPTSGQASAPKAEQVQQAAPPPKPEKQAPQGGNGKGGDQKKGGRGFGLKNPFGGKKKK